MPFIPNIVIFGCINTNQSSQASATDWYTIVAGCSSTTNLCISLRERSLILGTVPVCTTIHCTKTDMYILYIYIYIIYIYIYIYTSQIESSLSIWYGCSSPKSQFLSLDLPATMVATEIFPRPNSLMQRKRTMLWGVPHFRRIVKSQ